MWVPTEGVDVVIEADAVVLMFRSRSWGGEFGQIIRQRVPITWTLCALGGRRPWFRCDADYRGQYCGRRVALLYSGGGPFAFSRVGKIRMRLGAGFSFAEPFPEKPPRMHWRTYLRMRAAAAM
jgi:hypothetical protein